MNKDLYNILNVNRDADEATIKRAYHKLALKYHPDKNPNDVERFKDISEAYSILSDPEKRARYDHGGYDAANQQTNPFDIFNMFFQRKSTKKDLMFELNVDLADVYNGTTKTVPIYITIDCTDCKGTGGEGVKRCLACNGRGVTIKTHQSGFMRQQVQSMCVDCNGRGEKINPELCCASCRGKKINKRKRLLNVNIEQGMKDGEKILFPQSRESGNVVIVLNIVEHPIFVRHGNDLSMKMDINLTEALCGFSRPINTLDTRTLFIHHHGDVIKPGTIKCIHNEGIPIPKTRQKKGKLFVKFNIIFPVSVDKDYLSTLEMILSPRKKYTPLDTYERVSLTDDTFTEEEMRENQCPVQ